MYNLRRTPVTFIVIIVCVLIWLRIRNSNEYNRREDLVGKYCMIPMQVERGEWYRMITCAFIHVEFYHIFMNLYAMYNLGSLLEPYLGSIKFAMILFAAILGASFFVLKQNQFTRTIGLSGGLYGLLAAYFILLYKLGLFANPSVQASLIRTVVVNVAISFMPNVSMMGHLGGAVVGALISFLLI